MGSNEKSFIARLGSVPHEPDAMREYRQIRLRMLAFYLLCLLAGTWVLNALLNALFFSRFAAGQVDSPRSLVHLGLACLTAGLWGSLRQGTWSNALLSWVEAIAAGMVSFGFALMIILGDARLRSDMVMSMALSHLLVLRAALLPSTPQRTILLGAFAESFVIVAAYVLHRNGSGTESTIGPFSAAAAMSVWALLTLATTGIISSAIYGLTQRVREAMTLGQYSLEKKIGEGGMGVVYRARHALLRRPTAIKLMASANASEAQLARFAREVQTTARLSHANIVSVYDFGRSATGAFYYAMEYVDGIDLEHLVLRDGPQAPGRVLRILIQAADALAEAHAAGLVHRDIKPSNMILTPHARSGEQIKLVDFGLVKEVEAGRETLASDVFSVKGTPLYMAPETITQATPVDARTDLYSLGAVGYFLLTGAPVFDAKTVVEVCANHVYTPVVPASTRLGRPLPAELDRILLDCLAKSPANRPRSAQALLDRLERLHDCNDFSASAAADWWSQRAPQIRTAISEDQAFSSAPVKRIRIDPAARS